MSIPLETIRQVMVPQHPSTPLLKSLLSTSNMEHPATTCEYRMVMYKRCELLILSAATLLVEIAMDRNHYQLTGKKIHHYLNVDGNVKNMYTSHMMYIHSTYTSVHNNLL